MYKYLWAKQRLTSGGTVLHPVTHEMKVTKATQQGWQQLTVPSGTYGTAPGAMALLLHPVPAPHDALFALHSSIHGEPGRVMI